MHQYFFFFFLLELYLTVINSKYKTIFIAEMQR